MRTVIFILFAVLSLTSCKKKENPAPEEPKSYMKLTLNGEVVFDGEFPSDRYNGEVSYHENYNGSGVRGVDINIVDSQWEDLFDGNISGIPDVGHRLPLVDDPDFDPAGSNSSLILDCPEDNVYLSNGDLLNGLNSVSGEIQRDARDHLILNGQARVLVNYDILETDTLAFSMELRIGGFYEQ